MKPSEGCGPISGGWTQRPPISQGRAAWIIGQFRRLEFRTLLALGGVSATVWAFLTISDEVGEGETTAVDRRMLLALRTPGALGDPLGPRWFEEAARDVTALGGFTVLTIWTVVVVAALLFHRLGRQAGVLAGTMTAALISSEALKTLFDRARPDLVPHGSYVYSHSFPSGHSTLSAAAFLTTAAVLASLEERRRSKAFIFTVAVILTVGVGASRVYLGVHWPTDVLAGWSLGAGWALLGRLALTLTPQSRTEPTDAGGAVT
ncbi:MAG: phosphatase PAP2 family protein [Proteobacteria bacterium]|nr:phosphatase PAP2 family protein [Pseudomonadota bacterium]